MPTMRFARRTLLTMMAWISLGVSFAVAFKASPAFANASSYRVEFLIGDRVDPTRKWGHVSLRVVGDGKDVIYDFGRYGRMWNKDAEGDPIVRVWTNKYNQYVADVLKEGGTTTRFVFASTYARNAAIISSYERIIHSGKAHQKTGSWSSYVVGGRAFHAVDYNCTTTAIDHFMAGFPEYNLHISSYAKARDLGFFLSGAAQGYGRYDTGTGRWSRVWWPLDLRAILQDLYVKKGLAQSEVLRK